MSPNRLKHRQAYHKGKAIQDELAQLREREWRERRMQFDYEFHPVPLDDRELTSRLFGPEMKTVQWDPTSN